VLFCPNEKKEIRRLFFRAGGQKKASMADCLPSLCKLLGKRGGENEEIFKFFKKIFKNT
jgi:hypothetical protein